MRIVRVLAGLLFPVALACLSCSAPPKEIIRVHYNNNIPDAIEIHSSKIDTDYPDSISLYLDVQVVGSTGLSMLGEVTKAGDYFRFTPIVHLTRGVTYSLKWRSQYVGEITVPVDTNAPIPAVTGFFPGSDTIPENTLKLYVQFSVPMSEGSALNYVTVLNSAGDTLQGTFLDLQPELWNNDRTVLTLWIDPGRVKRDLIPNKEMGIPLPKGDHYSVIINEGWKSAAGTAMNRYYHKTWYVAERDEARPTVRNWRVTAPATGTTDELRIELDEPLDKWQLEREVTIMFGNDTVTGAMQAINAETTLVFKPEKKWEPGEYRVVVAGTLEDLAGNSFNRLFDTDLNKVQQPPPADELTVKFSVQ